MRNGKGKRKLNETEVMRTVTLLRAKQQHRIFSVLWKMRSSGVSGDEEEEEQAIVFKHFL